MNFTAATFNLRINVSVDKENAWPFRIHRASEAVKRIDPLFFGTQEGQYSMLADLQGQLAGYDWIGMGRRGGREDEHCAIFFKKDQLEPMDQGHFSLSENPQQLGSISWESSLPRICTWVRFRMKLRPETQFIVFNTHLDHRSQLAREKGISLIWHVIEQKRKAMGLPIVLMGDMNAEPDNAVIRFLRGETTLAGGISESGQTGETDSTDVINEKASDLIDAFTALPPSEQGGSFHGFLGGREGTLIDYIFVSPEIRVANTSIFREQIDGGYPSDHYPVAALLGL